MWLAKKFVQFLPLASKQKKNNFLVKCYIVYDHFENTILARILKIDEKVLALI